jgi:hypothetical protein
MLKGTGFADLWRPTGSLVVLAVLLFTISVRRFHKTIE